jgi:transposase-like protein
MANSKYTITRTVEQCIKHIEKVLCVVPDGGTLSRRTISQKIHSERYGNDIFDEAFNRFSDDTRVQFTNKHGKPRRVAFQSGRFLVVCNYCKRARMLKVNPGSAGRQNRQCASCAKKTKPTSLPKKRLDRADIASYRNGESALSIAQRFGVTTQTILRELRNEGITTRSMSSAIQLLDNSPRLKARRGELSANGELAKRLSAGHQHCDIRDWNGFRTPHWDRVRSSDEWKAWRRAVFERDNYRCVSCGTPSLKEKGKLHPHHIQRKSDFPELVFIIDNGVTLCRDCHLPTYGHEPEYAAQFASYVQSLKMTG